MSVAVEIARSLPGLADADESELRQLCNGWAVRGIPPLSNGEQAVVRWARITEEMLWACDAETVDAAVQVFDRMRAGMCR